MSIWTHVTGNIRFDSIRGFGKDEHFDPRTWIGPMETFEESNPDCTIPKGSEGSLQYEVYEDPIVNNIAAYSVSIFGDLRSFGTAQVHEIVEWLDNITKDRLVRQGVIYIQPEDGEMQILVHQGYGEKDAAWELVEKNS